MKRFTKVEHGRSYYPACFEEPCSGSGCTKELCAFSEEACERLAAYENTGLEPEEILSGKELAEIACALNDLKAYKDTGLTPEEFQRHAEAIKKLDVEHIHDLLQAENDGRLVVLPRKMGATVFDKICHKLFHSKGNGKDFFSRETGIKCGFCGCELETYYCESRLYLVECRHCKAKALVEAGSPKEAAYKTFAHAVYPIDEMGEGEAVFFSHVPINEPPVYVGSIIAGDFPEDVVCGMYLPCPGTDGDD